MKELANRLNLLLLKCGRQGVSYKELSRRMKKKEKKEFFTAMDELKHAGIAVEKRRKLYSSKVLGLFPAEITRVHKTFGFAAAQDGEEFFVPGRYLMGAMPGDKVLLRQIRSRGTSPEGEVYSVTAYGDGEFSGRLLEDHGSYYIEPDGVVGTPILVKPDQAGNAHAGDKVLARVTARGSRHSEHQAEIISVYGDAASAQSCANAILDLAGIRKTFPEHIKAHARQMKLKGVRPKDLQNRLDLRDEVIFTIDGADSKDLDDAVSLEKQQGCYVLGVHIADVSHYVRHQSELDEEAFQRGTSIYYANQVIPMLPKELSNGICSLHPDADRLTLSAILTLDLEGNLIDFDFQKSVIRSRVKGVYDEVNAIFAGQESEAVAQKYAPVRDTLMQMKELADILTENKRRRGAPDITTHESKMIIDDNGKAVDVRPRTSGDAERLIEEFMLTANEATAMAGKLKELPFLYRIHEPPSEDKLENLNKTLQVLGIQSRGFSPHVKPKALADILRKVRGMDIEPIVNLQVLRAMSKAKYSEDPVGHYGLALDNYAHFTSPIRRYPDLLVHRILSAMIKDKPMQDIRRKYGKYVVEAAKQSTQAEMLAMKTERSCEDCYKAEYMVSRLGDEFDGIISSVAAHGIYVELPNTVEGMVAVADFPEGQYEFDGMMEYKDTLSNRRFRVGQAVRVQCAKADVNSGNIDFVFVSE